MPDQPCHRIRGLQILPIVEDVTEHPRAAPLRESEKLLRLAAEAAQIGTWDLDLISDRGH